MAYSKQKGYDTATFYVGRRRTVVDQAAQIVRDEELARSFSDWLVQKCEELVADYLAKK